MKKHIACKDVVPGCEFTDHAAHAHGVTHITPELAAQVKAAIRNQGDR
jgi:predicted small metal-binding protein